MGAFVAFDVTRAATFDAVEKWKKDLDSKLILPSGLPIPAVLLANKVSKTSESLVHGKIFRVLATELKCVLIKTCETVKYSKSYLTKFLYLCKIFQFI